MPRRHVLFMCDMGLNSSVTRSSEEVGALKLSPERIRSGVIQGSLYAYPCEKSIRHFMEQIRKRTRRRVPVGTEELIEEINPVIRG